MLFISHSGNVQQVIVKVSCWNLYQWVRQLPLTWHLSQTILLPTVLEWIQYFIWSHTTILFCTPFLSLHVFNSLSPQIPYYLNMTVRNNYMIHFLRFCDQITGSHSSSKNRHVQRNSIPVLSHCFPQKFLVVPRVSVVPNYPMLIIVFMLSSYASIVLKNFQSSSDLQVDVAAVT